MEIRSTKLWSDVLKPPGEDRPLGYVASGSHGVWPGPGTWVYENVSGSLQFRHQLDTKTGADHHIPT